MKYLVLATDYDGTIAHDGVVEPDTVTALERLRASLRRLLPDLHRVMPRLDLFDRIVAENGALLYRPGSKEERVPANPPPTRFIERLEQIGVSPLLVGRVIVATWYPNEDRVMDAVRELGLEIQIVFNKDAVMALPPAVNKESGPRAARCQDRRRQRTRFDQADGVAGDGECTRSRRRRTDQEHPRHRAG
jgi:hydroxymethylpyrimidine pyrophosphatase-like HAD family hydrolase